MANALRSEDFTPFFEEVHHCTPFPWQRRLAAQVVRDGEWPDLLDLPTGSGKTAALDIAVFHLALEADRGAERRAPVRIVLAVDRRLVVDDAFARAKKIAAALRDPVGPVTQLVAERLKMLSYEGDPLLVRRLRGGIPLEDDWARTPVQPTILCSTVDQVGSRLLFRGYGVSNRTKPIHAGLLGSDCRILLDEAHLAEPFRQTLAWIGRYHSRDWCETRSVAPWGVSLLTATPGEESGTPFHLSDADYSDPVLAARWQAAKPSHLITLGGTSSKSHEATADDSERRPRMISEVRAALSELKAAGLPYPAIGVVVNRVLRARELFSGLQADFGEEVDAILMIGPTRPVDREVGAQVLQQIRTGEARNLDRPLVLVATQCIEAGVDIDLDGLISEAAPLDALRQRFGRLNRAGRQITPYAAVVASKSEISPRAEDPVYGRAIPVAWAYLNAAASAKRGEPPRLDFGLAAFADVMRLSPPPDEALSPKDDGPILLPAHVDLLSQTAPVPSADPEISLYLHGPRRQPASVTAVWRADIGPRMLPADLRRLLLLVPPRSAEAVELPLWAVRRWLIDGEGLDALADVADASPDDARTGHRNSGHLVFRWAGDEDRSDWIAPESIRPGDTLVIPADYGGLDQFGWNPVCHARVPDAAAQAAAHFCGRRFAVRLAPGLAPADCPDRQYEEALSNTLSAIGARNWRLLRDALLDLPLDAETRKALSSLDRAKGRGPKVIPYTDLYGTESGRPRGVVFVAPFGLRDGAVEDGGQPGSTENDFIGSLPGVAIPLEQHSRSVAEQAETFARLAGLPKELIQDLGLAGLLHDAGKSDPRFQARLAFGDPLGPDSDVVLAKSARTSPAAGEGRVGLPPRWRHEALSVRLAARDLRLIEASDPELVLWLIGTHHGWGRPFFPHLDERDQRDRDDLPQVLGLPSESMPAGHGPQSLAFLFRGLSWSDLFGRLKARYGAWELARMEAIVRLADHRVSERERTVGTGGAA